MRIPKVGSLAVALALPSLAISAGVFDPATGRYEGKVAMIGCHMAATDNQCYVVVERNIIVERKGGGCANVMIRWWGKSAEGAAAASFLTDAFLSQKTVVLYTNDVCFEGWSTYPGLKSFEIKN